MPLSRPPAILLSGLFALGISAAKAQDNAQPTSPNNRSGLSDPQGLGHMLDSMLPLVRRLEGCVNTGVADSDCVANNMDQEVHRRYGDPQPGQQTPDQMYRNFDRFFGGGTEVPYAPPEDDRRYDDGFPYPYQYGPGLKGTLPRPAPRGGTGTGPGFDDD